jgi:hypothetical protein
VGEEGLKSEYFCAAAGIQKAGRLGTEFDHAWGSRRELLGSTGELQLADRV